MRSDRPAFRPDPPPLPTATARLVLIGCVLWALAWLAVTVVPAWHEPPRELWPAICGAGLGLGLVGLLVLRLTRPPGAGNRDRRPVNPDSDKPLRG